MNAQVNAGTPVEETVTSLLGDTLDIKGRTTRNPYGMVAGAIGIGFLLGGGLFTRLTARIVGAGLRIGLLAALPALQTEVLRAISHPKAESEEGDSTTTPYA